MTQVLFAFVHPDGSPVVNAGFSVQLRKTGIDPGGHGVVVPKTYNFTTGADGTSLVELQPSTSVYAMVLSQGDDGCGGIRFKFYVPDSDEIIKANDLFLNPTPNTEPWDETAIRMLTEAKAAAIAAAATATTAAQVSQNGATASEASAVRAEAVIVNVQADVARAERARDASEGYSIEALAARQETDADRIAAQQAVLDAGNAAQVKVDAFAVELGNSADPLKGAGKMGRASRQIHSVNELLTVPGRYHGDQVSLTSYYGGWAVVVGGVPSGEGRMVWDSTSTAAPDGGKIFQVTGVAVGRWKRPSKHYYDQDFGVVGNGQDESEPWQRLMTSIPTGKTIVMTMRSRAMALTSTANSVKCKTDSATYLDSPSLMLHAATTVPLLDIGGFGWKFSEWAMEDASVAAGAVNMGSIAIRLRRSTNVRDVDATFSKCLFSRFDIGVNVVGINTQFNECCVFSQCLRPIVVDQVGTEIVRGIRVKDCRFHGRPTGLIDFCVTINGTSQAEIEITNNVADGIGGFYKGHLSRRSRISENQIATPAGDAFYFNGGSSGLASGNTIGGGEGNAMVLDGCTNPVIDAPLIDSMFKTGILVKNSTNWIIRDPTVFNVNLTYGTLGNIYDGISIEDTCTYGTLINPIIRQVNALSGRYGLNNQGNQTTIVGDPVIENFAAGNINQLITQRVYGDTGGVHSKRRVEYGTAPPTTGLHGATDILISTNVNQANPISEWVCTIAGTPGIWRPSKWAVFIGPTTGRPTTLRADDIGIQYMDTTLAPSGKPVWWRGSSWVDATGTAV